MAEPEVLVQQQVDAYNRRDTEGFADCYDDDARVLWSDGSVLVHGRPAIAKHYGEIFAQSPDLHVRVASRIVVGDFVIDEEHVSGFVASGVTQQLHAAAVYHVRDGKIAQAQLFM
jgi:uncharacterized protein (TIGR02246 family)